VKAHGPIGMRSLAVLLGAGALGAGALAAGLFTYLGDRPTHLVALGTPIRQDDFQYTVVGVTRAASIGGVPARGVFYVIKVRVENDALRVPYLWRPDEVRIVDASGRSYGYSPGGQRALDLANPAAVVNRGTTADFDVAFDVPRGIVRPQLAFSNGILMGDLFDGAAYEKARVPLD
jgi:hypothetical protein